MDRGQLPLIRRIQYRYSASSGTVDDADCQKMDDKEIHASRSKAPRDACGLRPLFRPRMDDRMEVADFDKALRKGLVSFWWYSRWMWLNCGAEIELSIAVFRCLACYGETLDVVNSRCSKQWSGRSIPSMRRFHKSAQLIQSIYVRWRKLCV